MIAACAAFGANAPNGAGEGSLSGVKLWSSVSGACIAGFAAVKQVQLLFESDRLIGRHTPRMRGIQYAAAYRFNHWRLWNTGSPAFAGDDN